MFAAKKAAPLQASLAQEIDSRVAAATTTATARAAEATPSRRLFARTPRAACSELSHYARVCARKGSCFQRFEAVSRAGFPQFCCSCATQSWRWTSCRAKRFWPAARSFLKQRSHQHPQHRRRASCRASQLEPASSKARVFPG